MWNPFKKKEEVVIEQPPVKMKESKEVTKYIIQKVVLRDINKFTTFGSGVEQYIIESENNLGLRVNSTFDNNTKQLIRIDISQKMENGDRLLKMRIEGPNTSIVQMDWKEIKVME